MPLTPEEKRTYEELKARLDKEQRTISRIIRYWVVTIVVVIVVGAAVDAVSSKEGKERYQRLDEQFLESLRQVNPLHIFNVYFVFVTYRAPACDPEDMIYCARLGRPMGFNGARCDVPCEFKSTKQDRSFPSLFFRPFLSMIYTGGAIAREGRLNIALLGFASLLSVIAAVMLLKYAQIYPLGCLLFLWGVPAMTLGFLSILFPFAWLVKIVFGGLVHVLIVAPSSGFIGALLLKVTEHHFSTKAIRRLAKEAG